MSTPEKNYSLGLVFSHNLGKLTNILLLLKKKPASQAGKYNGIGGRFEEGETWLDCIVRETKEEASLDTYPPCWTLVGALYKPKKWFVYVAYTVINEDVMERVPSACDEGTFLVTPINNLPTNVMPNIRWMIPLIENHKVERQDQFFITYLEDDED